MKTRYSLIVSLFATLMLCDSGKADTVQNELIVHNKGIGGNNSLNGRNRFIQDVVTLAPDYVYIYFGINDTLNEPQFVAIEEFIANLTWMIQESRSANIIPVLCTIHYVEESLLLTRHDPESYGEEGPSGKIDRYNAAIHLLASLEDVLLADFNEVLEDAGGATLDESSLVRNPANSGAADGVHLTPDGCRLLAKTFFDVVAENQVNNDSVVCIGDSVTYGANLVGAGTATGDTYPAFLRTFVLPNLGTPGLSFQEGISPSASYTADAVTIRADVPNNNQNSSDQILVGRYGGNHFRGLLEFDLSNIATAQAINNVSLVMTTDAAGADSGGGSITIHAYSYTNDFDETTATWNTPGAGDSAAGGTLGNLLGSASFNHISSGIVVSFTNSAALLAAVSNALEGDRVLRIILKHDDETTGLTDFVRFTAESATTAAKRPELIVGYVPWPEKSFQEGVSPSVAYTADAVTIRSDVPDLNQNDVDPPVIVVGMYNSVILRGLLEFDLSDLATAQAINNVSLVMTTGVAGWDNGDNTITIQAYSYTNDFDETTATWNSPCMGDNAAGGTFGYLLSSVSFNQTNVNLTVSFADSAAFRTAVSNALAGDQILRILLKRDTETSTVDLVRFASESSTTAANHPELIVGYVPLCAAMCILIQ